MPSDKGYLHSKLQVKRLMNGMDYELLDGRTCRLKFEVNPK